MGVEYQLRWVAFGLEFGAVGSRGFEGCDLAGRTQAGWMRVVWDGRGPTKLAGLSARKGWPNMDGMTLEPSVEAIAEAVELKVCCRMRRAEAVGSREATTLEELWAKLDEARRGDTAAWVLGVRGVGVAVPEPGAAELAAEPVDASAVLRGSMEAEATAPADCRGEVDVGSAAVFVGRVDSAGAVAVSVGGAALADADDCSEGVAMVVMPLSMQ